jgi:hypothetical protein
MSTRCTIGHSDDYHLYEECFDTKYVYLRLDRGFEAELCVGSTDWRDNASSARTMLTIKMDVKLWRAIAEAWSDSEWAKHPERVGSELVVNVPEWLENLTKKTPDEGGQDPA